MKQYYYFYTSLTDLYFDIDKVPYSLKDFISSIEENVDEIDYEVIKAFLYRFDNLNIVNILEKKEGFNDLGVFSREVLEEEVKTPVNIPDYMKKFLDNIRHEDSEYAQYSLEDQLSIYYYQYLVNHPNNFVREFTKFEFNSKNVLAALNCRKYKYETENHVLELNEEAHSLINSSSSDFGVSKDFTWLHDVLRIYEEGDVLDIEKKLDKFKFAFIDSLLTFEYFTIGKILGYLIKLFTVERWTQLEPQKGTEIFEDITQNMVGNIELASH